MGSNQRWSRGHKARGQGHKKIRGQGQPFRGQTLSRPRAGMLEAKDQGHKRKCSPKKKGLHKNFSSDLHKKTFSKKFFKRFTKFYQFKKYCCPRAEDRSIFEDLRPRGQGQGLQNVSSRTPPLVAIMQIKIAFLSSIFSACHNVRTLCRNFLFLILLLLCIAYDSVTLHSLLLW